MTMLIQTPDVNDVLCGQDKTNAKHAGNVLYRIMIHAAAVAYAEAVSKQEKMRMTTDIVEAMHEEHNGRFLKLSSRTAGLWEELSATAARDKTSHALRFCAANTTAATATATTATVTTTSGRRTAATRRPSKAAAAKTMTNGKKKQHRRTVSLETASSVECIPSYDYDYYAAARPQVDYAAVEHMSSCLSVVSSHPTVLEPVQVLSLWQPEQYEEQEDLDAILREPLRWEDDDSLFFAV